MRHVLSLRQVDCGESEAISEYVYQWTVGELVPLAMTGFIQQEIDCIFKEDEEVALVHFVASAEKGVPRYMVALVMPKPTEPQGFASSLPTAFGGALVVAAEDSHLLREYLLKMAEGALESRKHCDIFKIRQPSSSAERVPRGRQAGISDASSATAAVGETAPNAERAGLVAQLRQMESASEADYKKLIFRLLKTWHPDKNKLSHTVEFFRIVRRHMDAYSGSRDFSFLHAFSSGAEVADALVEAEEDGSSAAYTAGAAPHSWFAEFEKDRQREAEAVAMAQKQTAEQKTAHEAMRAAIPSWPSGEALNRPLRKLDPGKPLY